AKREQQDVQAAMAENREGQHQGEARRAQTHSAQVSLEAQRQGIAALKTKDELEQSIRDAERELNQKARPVHEQSLQLGRNVQATDNLLSQWGETSLGVELPALDSRDFLQAGRAVVGTADKVTIDLGRLLAKDWVGLEQLEKDLDE